MTNFLWRTIVVVITMAYYNRSCSTATDTMVHTIRGGGTAYSATGRDSNSDNSNNNNHDTAAAASPTPIPTATIYIVRHGETTWKRGCLNIQGQERANNFPQLFNSTNQQNHATTNGSALSSSSSSSQPYFATPTGLFANNYVNDDGTCERCLVTVLPLSQALESTVPIDFHHGYPASLGSNAAAAVAIRTKLWNQHFIEHNATTLPVIILVAWEHDQIPVLTHELGVPKSRIPSWDEQEYDTVYVLTVQITTGILSRFEVRAQHYTPQSTTCDPQPSSDESKPPSTWMDSTDESKSQ